MVKVCQNLCFIYLFARDKFFLNDRLYLDLKGILHGKKIRAESGKVNTDRQRYHARIPPELLVVIDARIEVMKSFYLLPSLMHRLESLMLSSQLREEITGRSTDLRISSSLVSGSV